MNNSRFKYRPPIKYLFIGLGGIIISPLFAMLISKDEIVVSIIGGLFSLIMLAMGLGFLIIYIRKFNVGDLVIGKDFLEIPGRWKDRVKVDFNNVKNIGDFNTYDHVIEIESEQGIHLIEKQWMKKQEFDKARELLIKKINND